MCNDDDDDNNNNRNDDDIDDDNNKNNDYDIVENNNDDGSDDDDDDDDDGYNNSNKYVNITYLCLIVRPGAEFHPAGLFVKREERDVNFTRTLQTRRRRPENAAVTGHHGVHLHVTGGEVVSTEEKKDWCFRPRFCTVRLYWAGDYMG